MDTAVRVLESKSVGYAHIAPCIYSGFSILGHHDLNVIAADYAFSEALAARWLAEELENV